MSCIATRSTQVLPTTLYIPWVNFLLNLTMDSYNEISNLLLHVQSGCLRLHDIIFQHFKIQVKQEFKGHVIGGSILYQMPGIGSWLHLGCRVLFQCTLGARWCWLMCSGPSLPHCRHIRTEFLVPGFSQTRLQL